MGASSSKSEIYANTLINAAMSVVNSTVASSDQHVYSWQEIRVRWCRNVEIHDINFQTTVMMDAGSVATALSDTHLDQKIKAAIDLVSKAAAEAALMFADAQSEVIANTTLMVTQAVVNTCSALAANLASSMQNIDVVGCDKANIYGVDMGVRADLVSKTFSSSKDMTEMKQAVEAEVDAHSETEAKGWNPTLLVVAIVIVILLFVFGGFDMIAANVLKPSVWFLVSLLLTAYGAWKLVCGYTHNAIYPTDTEQQKAQKEKWHHKDKEMGWWIGGVGAVASVVTAFIFITSKKK